MNVIVKDDDKPVAKVLHNGIFFLVYKKDTLETVLNRYSQQYPAEAKAMMEEVRTRIEYDDKGVTRQGLLRLGRLMPIPVYYAMKFLYHEFHGVNNYWSMQNPQNYTEFALLAPKLCIGTMTSERGQK